MLELIEMATEVGLAKNSYELFANTTGKMDDVVLDFLQTDVDAMKIGTYMNESRIVVVFSVNGMGNEDEMQYDGDNIDGENDREGEHELPEVGEGLGYMGQHDEGNRGDDAEGVEADKDNIKDNTEGVEVDQRNNEEEIYDDLIVDEGDEDLDDNNSVGSDSQHSDGILDSDCDKTDDEQEYVVRDQNMEQFWSVTSSRSSSSSSKRNPNLYDGYQVFNPRVDMDKPEFFVGLCFDDVTTFRKAVRGHSIKSGRDLQFVKNDKNRVLVKCKNPRCAWKIFASESGREKTFQVKTYNGLHDCIRSERVSAATSTWLADKYETTIRTDPDWKVDSFKQTAQHDNGILFSRFQMYRAKAKVKAMTLGNEHEQYNLLWRYAAEIVRSDRENTVRIKTRRTEKGLVFKRFYICWGSLKKGFLEGCRPVICLDGCHLKTYCGGILLTAVGIDANNSMYPFAYAVVEKEKGETWNWFLNLLIGDLGITEDGSGAWTVMSDKQKGLIDAVRNLLPYSDHRFCVMHLYSNFKQAHKGLSLKYLLWKAAKCTTILEFEKTMNELKKKDLEAFKWLAKRPAAHWSRAYFNARPKCDILLNNLSESFNALIVEARTKPIIDMLEHIRLILMKRVYVKRDLAKKWKELCPNIEKMVNEARKRGVGHSPMWNGLHEFEVTNPGGSRAVNLELRTCTCRKWQLTGIPCEHAVSAMLFMGHKPEEWVDDCYKTETYMNSYKHCMHIFHAPSDWPHSNMPPPAPPVPERMPGRPKKNDRKKTPQEVEALKKRAAEGETVKMCRKGMVMRCKFCGEPGHNKRSCPKRKAMQEDEGERMEVPPHVGGSDEPERPTKKKTKARRGKKQTKIDEGIPSPVNASGEGCSTFVPNTTHESVPSSDIGNVTEDVPLTELMKRKVKSPTKGNRGKKMSVGMTVKADVQTVSDHTRVNVDEGGVHGLRTRRRVHRLVDEGGSKEVKAKETETVVVEKRKRENMVVAQKEIQSVVDEGGEQGVRTRRGVHRLVDEGGSKEVNAKKSDKLVVEKEKMKNKGVDENELDSVVDEGGEQGLRTRGRVRRLVEQGGSKKVKAKEIETDVFEKRKRENTVVSQKEIQSVVDEGGEHGVRTRRGVHRLVDEGSSKKVHAKKSETLVVEKDVSGKGKKNHVTRKKVESEVVVPGVRTRKRVSRLVEDISGKKPPKKKREVMNTKEAIAEATLSVLQDMVRKENKLKKRQDKGKESMAQVDGGAAKKSILEPNLQTLKKNEENRGGKGKEKIIEPEVHDPEVPGPEYDAEPDLEPERRLRRGYRLVPRSVGIEILAEPIGVPIVRNPSLSEQYGIHEFVEARAKQKALEAEAKKHVANKFGKKLG